MYSANKELTDILLKHGFVDVTSKRDEAKGKKEYKLSKTQLKYIYFDYEYIRIVDSHCFCDGKTSLTKDDLKLVLFYFSLTSRDKNHLSLNRNFNFKEWHERLVSLRGELLLWEEYNVQKRRQNVIKRILTIYDSIII